MGNELKRILYVEDEADIREIARLALEMVAGFTLDVCSSGAEALERFGAFAPDLVLLDVMMPDLDGPTTLRRLRELPGGATVPVAFMTAKVQPEEVAHLTGLGAIGVIAKPFDPMSLGEQVRRLWQEGR